MFLGPYDQGGDFRDSGIAGTKRFLDRVWRQFESGIGEQSSPATKHALQEMVAKMRDDLGHFRYNTAISAWMTFMNVWQDEGTLSAEDAKTVVRCFAPIAPYMAEELWNRLQGTAFSDKSNSVHRQLYPEVNEADMVTKPFLMVAQVNGKMRHTLEVPVSDFQSWQQPEIELRQRFEQEPLLAKWLDGKKIIKVVYVPPTTKRQGMLNWVVD
jgi:leucyl-tRNA synthetase